VEVYVGNLPGNATLMDLHAFVGDAVLRADFQCCKGQDQHDRAYHFFIARAESRKAGLELIARLNGKAFGGQLVVAREYVQRRAPRAWAGEERRINPWAGSAAWSGPQAAAPNQPGAARVKVRYQE
jgi:hypothetical protein